MQPTCNFCLQVLSIVALLLYQTVRIPNYLLVFDKVLFFQTQNNKYELLQNSNNVWFKINITNFEEAI